MQTHYDIMIPLILILEEKGIVTDDDFRKKQQQMRSDTCKSDNNIERLEVQPKEEPCFSDSM